MNLLTLNQRHPSFLTIVGTTSGAASWILAHSAQITAIAGMIGAVFSASLAVSAALAKLIGWILLQRKRRWRKRMCRRDPADDNFDFGDRLE